MHEMISWKSDPRANFRHHNSRDRGGAGNHLRVARVDLDRRRRRWKRSVTAIRVFVQSEQRKKQGGATAKMLTGTTVGISEEGRRGVFQKRKRPRFGWGRLNEDRHETRTAAAEMAARQATDENDGEKQGNAE
ncbi:hypothetical protein ACJRO7_029236 [Eucalyptus globulus]|uniref:Uncharacterized protein n=1 Tax=Eucalyptus globulus TaxID=34317 RepID=A0ABD3K486_EUCGL